MADFNSPFSEMTEYRVIEKSIYNLVLTDVDEKFKVNTVEDFFANKIQQLMLLKKSIF